jgi:hypothetical protein
MLNPAERTARRAEALDRAENGQSARNYAAIIDGFKARGIPEPDILPRENVFTYAAWQAKGRQVMKGQHGVRITTFVDMTKRDDQTGERSASFRRPRPVSVFHISQTCELGQADRTTRRNLGLSDDSAAVAAYVSEGLGESDF